MIKYFFVLLILITTTVSANDPIHSVHCPLGCPSNTQDNDLVFYHIFTLSNNPATKLADWVAYEVNPNNFGRTPGRAWRADAFLSPDKTLEPKDYSKANKDIDVDRGHQAPLASFAGSRYWYEANYLSNITPQKSGLNQGAWKDLEDTIRNTSSYYAPLYVITGPIFDPQHTDLLPKADEDHQIPVGYFKVIYKSNGEHIAFKMLQSLDRNSDYCSQIVSYNHLQSLARFDFPDLPKKGNGLQLELGC